MQVLPRMSTDSAISIQSLDTRKKEQPVFVLKAEKSFLAPPQIRVSSRGWIPLQETSFARATAVQQETTNWPSDILLHSSGLTVGGVSKWFGNRGTWTKKQNLHCIIIGLLLCIIITLGLGLFLHLQSSQQPYDSSAGPTGSIPGSLPGPPLPVLGVATVIGNSTSVYFGVELDWKFDDPAHFNGQLGYSAAIQEVRFPIDDNFSTAGIVNSSGYLHTVSDIYNWTAALIRGTGAIMGMSIIPTVPLYQISNSTLKQLALKCKSINDMGIPIILKYSPQMNGNWYTYSQDPENFKTTFIYLQSFLRNTTNNTALAWVPYSGLNDYPWGNTTKSNYLLDTNLDGVVNSLDDPYSPYYPGDYWVDWVGLEFQQTSNYTIPSIDNSFIKSYDPPAQPPLSPYYKQLFNTPNTENDIPTRFNHFDFYPKYSEGPKKPFMFSSGSAYFKGQNVVNLTDELDTKGTWANHLLDSNFFQQFPLLKGISFSNYATLLNDSLIGVGYDAQSLVDFRISSNSSVLGFYQKSIQNLLNSTNSSFLAPRLKFASQNTNQTIFLSRNSK